MMAFELLLEDCLELLLEACLIKRRLYRCSFELFVKLV
jgi:hypothetical protein